ncbi:peptidase family M1-domain-containing protein [Gilbertella persicaria]|uniref:peptidase family M1-domain-containing protein n=1 Tax=Gilbertella persicaria TaxID=101096 RepID=UPI00221F6801|nr:peptidase family M1-domain-containing protein [Gilbertella persicaria]KAI8073423.1 peptidase family M1-domain-containing protein [Gilbertella persicaria]
MFRVSSFILFFFPSTILYLYKMCIPSSTIDLSTQANIDQIKTSHIHLNWNVDFDNQNIHGNVVLDLVTLVDNVEKVVLDTSYLEIKSVLLGNDSLKFDVAGRYASLGSALNIDVPKIEKKGTKLQLKINYETTNKCTAIQFLKPEQTLGGKHPYLFSQSEPIHGRAMIPCQDSPSVKVTYSASIRSRLPVVMSALQTGVEEDLDKENGYKTYHFRQNTTIPSYLIAIAVGNLVGREIGPRSTVWCEPEMIEQAAWEFSDTESFVATGEGLLTPYEWGRYDLLVLPPSFPYGGMENPCLTFVTPTLLAGDKSAVNVIAHEIAHSWMGNLVTTNSWKHYWLNEGWTVFIERKILGRLHGEPTRQFEALSGLKSLQESVDLFGKDSPKTVLNPDLRDGADPDDFFSKVPYEKGFNFLYHIEKVVGGPAIFEPYMKAYVKHFASTSISTEDWKAFLFEYMEKTHGPSMIEKLNTIDFDAWINQPGMPPVDPEFDTTLADACYNLAKRWDQARHHPDDLSAFKPEDVSSFSAGQKIVFLEKLTDVAPLPHALISKMDELYRLTLNHNADLRLRWQQVCLMASYEPIYPEVVKFVTEQGRMKFVRPLYRLLHQAKNGSQLAVDTYLKHKSFYHPIAAQLIEKDIGIKK